MTESTSHFSSGRKPFKKGSSKNAGRGTGKSSNTSFPKRKYQGSTSSQSRPFYQTRIAGKTGAQPGDYVIISNGREEITTRVNLSSHPFARKDIGTRVSIKGESWKLIRILHQGTQEYNRVYDADTEREHYGY